MSKKNELEQEFNHYAKRSDCDAIIRYAACLFKERELFEFMAEDDSKDLLGISKAASEIVGVAKDLLMKLVGPMTEEAGLFLGNEIKYFRVLREKRIERLLEKTDQLLQERNIEPQPVKMEILIPIFDYSSLLEENNQLNERWVELLAAAASGQVIKPDYPRILAGLGSLEVAILDNLYLFSEEDQISVEKLIYRAFSIQEIIKNCLLPINDVLEAIDNLYRLELCTPTNLSSTTQVETGKLDKVVNWVNKKLFGDLDSPPRGTAGRYEYLSLTPLGYNFIKVCYIQTKKS